VSTPRFPKSFEQPNTIHLSPITPRVLERSHSADFRHLFFDIRYARTNPLTTPIHSSYRTFVHACCLGIVARSIPVPVLAVHRPRSFCLSSKIFLVLLVVPNLSSSKVIAQTFVMSPLSEHHPIPHHHVGVLAKCVGAYTLCEHIAKAL
jgi:hypothetical protein